MGLVDIIDAKRRENAAKRANNASKNFAGNESLTYDTSRLNASNLQTQSYLVDSTYDSFHSSGNTSNRSINESRKKLSTNHKDASFKIPEQKTNLDNIENDRVLASTSILSTSDAKPILSRCLSDTRIKLKDQSRADDSKSTIGRGSSFHQLPDSDDLLSINGHLYRKDKVIGKGGSSVVWSALNMATKQEVAIKIVRLHDAQGIIEAYTHEIAILEKLRNCRHVIQLYDHEFAHDKQSLYIVLEKGDTDFGTFIKERQRSKQINDKFIHFYWEEMLLCVQDIHEKGIIHKDLKPANFLLVSGNLKLIDFGISSVLPKNKDSIRLSVILGTPSYMAPERLSGNLEITVKVDIWSLGCILYAIVFGSTPFQKYTEGEKVKAICDPNVEIKYPSHHDGLLIESIKLCLTRDAHYRASIKDLLAHPFCDSKRSAMANFAADLLSKTPNSRQRELERLCRRFEATSLSASQLDL